MSKYCLYDREDFHAHNHAQCRSLITFDGEIVFPPPAAGVGGGEGGKEGRGVACISIWLILMKSRPSTN